MKTLLLRVIGLIPLLIGLFLMHRGGKNLLEAYNSKSWNQTEGTITISEVRPLASIPSSSMRNPVPVAHIEYTFVVNEITYTADRRSFNDYGSDVRDQQQNIVDRYPVGKKVTVYFDPGNPQHAIIEHNIPFVFYLTFAGGLFFGLIGYLFIFKLPGMF